MGERWDRHAVPVLGWGNPIPGDDGAGLVMARRRRDQVAAATIDERRIGGLDLRPEIGGLGAAVVVDAFCAGSSRPGRVRRFEAEDLGDGDAALPLCNDPGAEPITAAASIARGTFEQEAVAWVARVVETAGSFRRCAVPASLTAARVTKEQP